MGFYKIDGRTLMVKFTCGRCGETYLEDAEIQSETTEGNLQCYQPPKGWRDSSYGVSLLCPKCAEQLTRFLKNEGDVINKMNEETRKVGRRN